MRYEDPDRIDAYYVNPTQKDYDRVANITSDAKAASMARAIKDPYKMINRARAYIIKFGPGNNPFVQRMQEMGFTNKQIMIISYPDMHKFFENYK